VGADFMKRVMRYAETFLDIFVWFWHFVDHPRKNWWLPWENNKCVKSLWFFTMSQEC